jgi:aminotransferase
VTDTEAEPSGIAHISNRVARLHRVGSRELEDAIGIVKKEGVDVLKLEGGPKLPLPPHVLEAGEKAMRNPTPQPSRGRLDLRESLARAFSRSAGVPVDGERNVLVTSGCMHALNIVLRGIINGRDSLVVPTPNFFFDGIIHLAGGDARFVTALEADGWSWNLDEIASAVDSQTKAIVVSNPTNPTGYVPSAEALAGLIQIARENGVLLISDESYDRLVFDEHQFTSAAQLDPELSTVVVVRSLSKSYALAPWRIGYIVAAEELIDVFMKILEWECLYVSDVGQAVAVAAIEGPQEWLDDVLVLYTENRAAVREALDATGHLSSATPMGAPFFFVNLSKAPNLTTTTLLQHGIPTVAGEHFGAPSYVRLPFGGDRATISILADRLKNLPLPSEDEGIGRT